MIKVEFNSHSVLDGHYGNKKKCAESILKSLPLYLKNRKNPKARERAKSYIRILRWLKNG